MNLLQIGHGYIGAYMAEYLSGTGHSLTVCDEHDVAGLPSSVTALHCRYQDLRVCDLASFDAIIWFAGHSSVPKATADPNGALANNCFDLLEFARRKPVNVPLIYASTASLYSVEHQDMNFEPPILDESETRLNPVNPYDCSKVAFDAIAAYFTSGLTGLRLGTVCGYSTKLRRELIFNSMNLSAITEGRVRLSNPHAWRAILFMDDLANVVEALLGHTQPLPAIVNVASCNIRTSDLANGIAAHHQVPIETLPNAPTYSFRMDCSLVHNLCGDVSSKPLEERCAQFVQAIDQSRTGA